MADWGQEVACGTQRHRHQEGLGVQAQLSGEARSHRRHDQHRRGIVEERVKAIAATRANDTAPTGGSAAAATASPLAISSAPPVLLMASLIGMRQASSTRIGSSIAS